MIINLILNSRWNQLSDIQAARHADDNYRKYGATLKGLMKYYKEYFPIKKNK